MRISKFILLLCIVFALLANNSFAQEAQQNPADEDNTAKESQKPLTPIDTVKQFYKLLREKKYVEGFRLSVYRDAIENLTPAELKELEPDFEITFSRIPETVKIIGSSQSTNDSATVFIKSSDDPKDPTADEVALIQVDGRWLVGDAETLELVKGLGNKFFSEVRIRAHEDAAQLLMGRYIGAQKLYADANKGVYGTIDELVASNFWPPSLKSGEIEGYKFTIELSKEKREFWVHAEPIAYNKSGRVSIYGDLKGVYKLDTGGQIFRGPQSLSNNNKQ